MAITKTCKQCPKSHRNWSHNHIGITWASRDRKVGKSFHSRISTQTNNHRRTHFTSPAIITTRIWIANDNDLSIEVLISHLMIVKMIAGLQWHASPVQSLLKGVRNKSLAWIVSNSPHRESSYISFKMMTMFCIIWIFKSPRLSKLLMSISTLRYQIFTSQ